MWEKQEDAPAIQLPGAAPRPKVDGRAQENGSLVFVQTILCVLVVLFVLAAKVMDASFLPELREEYTAMLSEGIDFSSDTPVARWASGAADGLREGARGILEQLEGQAGGQGGFWPVKDQRQPPEGASLEPYTAQEALFLPVSGTVTSTYGFRDNPVNGEDDFHAGVDIAAAHGTPVRCALSGQVTRTGTSAARGNYIIVRHANGLQTLYQHLSCAAVRAGETVAEGQVIGNVGSTGVSTGPHLHIELIVDGVRVDPQPSLPGLS